MYRRIFAAAILAGFLSGIIISVIQEFTTTPIILHAEQFEAKAGDVNKKQSTYRNSMLILAHGKHGDWAKNVSTILSQGKRWERIFFTTITNIIMGIGFGFLLVACFSISKGKINGRTGVIWGAAGFSVISLAPSLGLPPELPGAPAVELASRQGWWFFCVAATATGISVLVFLKGVVWVIAGLSLIALPQIVGGPKPEIFGGNLPAELASHFVAASLVTAAIFWSVLGWLSGTFWQMFEKKDR